MASVSSPYGVMPISDNVGNARPSRLQNGILSGMAFNIFKNQPVKIDPVSGTFVPVASAADKIWGIFEGVEFTPLGGRPAVSPLWAAGTVVDTTYDFFVYVTPFWTGTLRMQVQADGSVTQGNIGQGFSLTNIGAGNLQTGLSACTVGAAGVAAGTQAQFTLVEFYEGVSDTIGDAFTDLIVIAANPQVGFASQVSLG